MKDSIILNKVEKKGRRFLLQGSHPRLIQGPFEDKFKHSEEGKIEEDDMNELGFFYCCRKGLKPQSPNQDNFLVGEFEKYKLCGVFDGHGPYGHDVSDQIGRFLPIVILEKIQSSTDDVNMIKILKDSFNQIHEQTEDQAETTGKFDCALSGSTCTFAVIDTESRRLWVAHVGDSRSIICLKESGKQKAKEITLDHKANLPGELSRIESMGGEVRKVEGDIPYRVQVKNKRFPGLAMSRALGDLIAHSVGVSCDPDVAEFEIQPSWNQLILCSDGVWEFMTTKSVTATAYGNRNDLNKACIDMAQQSWKRWIDNEEDVVDDITSMIFDFSCLK